MAPKPEASSAKMLVLQKARLEGVELAVQELVAAGHWAARLLQDAAYEGENGLKYEVEAKRAAIELLELLAEVLEDWGTLRDHATAIWVLVGRELTT
jgi:hypothetical protein